MEQLYKPEVIASVGALGVSIGSFVYLNSQISSINETVTHNADVAINLKERLGTIVLKSDQQDTDIRIFKSKLTEVENIVRSYGEIQEELESIRETLLDYDKKIKNQDKLLKRICKNVNKLGSDFGLERIEDPEDNSHKRSNSYKKSKPNLDKAPRSTASRENNHSGVNNNHSGVNNNRLNDKSFEEDVFAEMLSVNST